MDIPVVIERDAKSGFRASTGEPLRLIATGASRAVALKKLEELLRRKLRNGTELIALKVAAKDDNNPWVQFAGMFKDDPMFGRWQKAIEEYRREVDEDPAYQ